MLTGLFLSYAVVQVLIAAGADVDLQTQQSDGDLWDTALHLAVFHGHLSAGDTAVQYRKDN